jgi:hypothetical protein
MNAGFPSKAISQSPRKRKILIWEEDDFKVFMMQENAGNYCRSSGKVDHKSLFVALIQV